MSTSSTNTESEKKPGPRRWLRPPRRRRAFIKSGDQWLPLVQSATTFNSRSVDVLQAIGERTLASHAAIDGRVEGIADEEDVCFPMVPAEKIVGVLGIRNRPALTREDRRSIGAAAAVIAIGVRNVGSPCRLSSISSDTCAATIS